MPAAPVAGAGGGVLTPGVGPPLRSGPGDRVVGPRLPGYGPTLPVPGPGFVMPKILSPGIGPNGPGPIDARRPETSVGERSSVPYSFTNGYANPNGVTGFIGPAAGSLRQPTAWYVRTTGANTNGGSSAATTPDRSGTDGATTSGSLTFTSVSAAFTPADIGKGICIQNATRCYAKIVSLNSATSVQLSNPPSATASGLSWAIGGAWADPTPILNCTSFANTTCGVQSGDSVYVGAGTYRVIYALGANFGAAWNPTGGTVKFANAYFNGQAAIVGDVTGQFTGDAGMVQLTAYTTNDKTAPSATQLLNLNGKSNLAFSNLFFVGGSATIVVISAVATSQNVTFIDCASMSFTGGFASLVCGPGQKLNLLIDRCILFCLGQGNNIALTFTLTTGSNGDYDSHFVIQNSQILFPRAISVVNSGTLAGKGGGGIVRNSYLTGYSTSAVATTASQISVIFPLSIFNSIINGAGVIALSAGTSGQIVEDYNLIYATTPRSLVSAGAHSVSDGSYAPLFHFGQERIWLPPLFRPFGEPMAGSPLLGFGNDGAQTPYDLRGPQNIRPAGGSSFLPAVGALERADTFVADPSPIRNGGSPIQLTGPGYNDFLLAVPSGMAIQISVWVEWDSNYAGALPQIQIEGKPQLGIVQQTVAATGTANNVVQISLAPFTPTAGGVANVRLLSNDLSGVSVVRWDDFSVT